MIAVRPSTLLRSERLSRLIDVLARCDMGYREAATLLQCSPSTARNYMFELMDAQVVVPVQVQCNPGCAKPMYRLNPDTRVVAGFKAALGGAQSALRREPFCDSTREINYGAVQRDPLVAALFGMHGAAGEQSVS